MATLQNVVDDLFLADALSLGRSFGSEEGLKACTRSRASPLRYLSQTFSYPLTLLSVMFDTDCVLTGPRALGFFVPGAAKTTAPYDFYLPGYKESVADVISALTYCGVTWDLKGDTIVSALHTHGSIEVDAWTLKAFHSWMRDMSPSDALAALGPMLYTIVSIFQNLHAQSRAGKYLLSYSTHLGVQVEPLAPVKKKPTISPERLHVMHGHIHGSNKKVRLIIGRFYSGTVSFVEFLHSFYNKRMHCFLGGWCASHLSYFDTISTRSHPLAPKRYESYGINSTQSLFIDYGSLYHKYIPKDDKRLLRMWLKECRDSVGAVRWVVVRDHLIMMYRPEGQSRGEASASVPLIKYRRLGDLIALNIHVPARLRNPLYGSSVARTISGDTWWVSSVVRSGGVFGPLAARQG